MNQQTTSPAQPFLRGASLLFLATLASAAGCQTSRPKPVSSLTLLPPPPAGLTPLSPLTTVQAMVCPPVGWRPDPLKSSTRHTHQVWISPTGHTAYGVIHFTIPLPVSANFLLPFYLSAWRKDQGEATLITKTDDPSLPGLRFVAEGGRYKTWSNLITSGTDAWSIYAATLRTAPPDPTELPLAESARDQTHVGLPTD